MCGIAGIVRVSPSLADHHPIPDEWIDLLDAHIAWRGIDGAGRFFDIARLPDGRIVEVALIHRRLSIIDHAGGHQPMAGAMTAGNTFELFHPTEVITDHIGAHPEGIAVTDLRQLSDQRKEALLSLAFNGCLYSNARLRTHLESSHQRFDSSHSDTETFLRAFHYARQLDPRAADEEIQAHHLEGMYAYALWDRANANLTTGRDRFGEKPLYRFLSKGTLAFASTHAALSHLYQTIDPPRRSASLPMKRDAIELWIRYGFNTSKLPHEPIALTPHDAESFDHRAIHAAGKPTIVGIMTFVILALIPLIWVISALITIAIITGIAAAFAALFTFHNRFTRPPLTTHEDVRPLLSNAVAQRLESDEPVACLLSGGIDSSLVAYFAAQHTPTLTTISVRMPDDRYDESAYAERVAKIIGTNHYTVDVHPDPATDLVNLIECIGLPFADSSILPTYWACRAAALHAKVLLTGDGADELFFGYDRYRAARAMSGITALLARLFPSRWLADASDPTSAATRRRRFLEALRHGGYIELVSIFPTPLLNRLLPKRRAAFRLSDDSMPEKSSSRPRSADKARAWDLEHYLPSDILLKLDTASLAAGVEARCPFLDSQLSLAAITTPRRIHMRHAKTKALLKDLARTFLPDEIVDRPKQGFAIPIGEWFRSDYGGMRTLLMDLVAEPASRKNGRPFGPVHDIAKIDNRYVLQLINEHFAAGGLAPPSLVARARPRDHSQRLFLLTTLAIWARTL